MTWSKKKISTEGRRMRKTRGEGGRRKGSKKKRYGKENETRGGAGRRSRRKLKKKGEVTELAG